MEEGGAPDDLNLQLDWSEGDEVEGAGTLRRRSLEPPAAEASGNEAETHDPAGELASPAARPRDPLWTTPSDRQPTPEDPSLTWPARPSSRPTTRADTLTGDLDPVVQAGDLNTMLEAMNQRVETLTGAVVTLGRRLNSQEEAKSGPGGFSSGDRIEEAIKRLERIEETVEVSLNESASLAVRAITDAAEHLAAQLTQPRSIDRVSSAAIARLEEEVSRLARQLETAGQDEDPRLQELQQTVARLASAHAEDLERILDRVEDVADAAAGNANRVPRRSVAEEQRLARVEAAITALGDQAPDGGIVGLAHQVEALRRRLAVQGRSTSSFDLGSLDELADAVVARLAATQPWRADRSPLNSPLQD